MTASAFQLHTPKYPFNMPLRLSTWLHVDKLKQIVYVQPKLINAVRSIDRDGGGLLYGIDFSIHGEKDVRERILHHDGCPEALFLAIELMKRLRERFMIAIDAQQGRGNTRR